jgi:pimeloyl-ACP methyl ester carboxylesterase
VPRGAVAKCAPRGALPLGAGHLRVKSRVERGVVQAGLSRTSMMSRMPNLLGYGLTSPQLPPNRHEWDAGCKSTTAQESFGGVYARTLILRGSLTRLVTKEIADVLCETFPQWRLQEIQGAGHMGPLTHAAIINAEIGSFLAASP